MKTEDTSRAAQQSEDSGRKPYRKPQVVEWGSVLDLTRGSFGGYTDSLGGASSPFFRYRRPDTLI